VAKIIAQWHRWRKRNASVSHGKNSISERKIWQQCIGSAMATAAYQQRAVWQKERQRNIISARRGGEAKAA